MANFAELNAKEMNETNGGIAPILIPVVVVPIAAYAAYKALKK
jgi:lactobin A/cerein 7B family class IIb bacteriocin